jgi:hypothetical protein
LQRTFLVLLAACSGPATTGDADIGEPIGGDADTDADSDADADADADSDADADTAPPVDTSAHLRVLHVAPGLPPQDLLGNGVAGVPAMVGLSWLDAFPAVGYVERPPNTFTFELLDSGSAVPWTTFDATMDVATFYSLVIVGTRDDDTGGPALPAPQVLVLEDPRDGIPAGEVRVRWTNGAVTLADRPYALRDALTGATYATLAFGASAETDQAPDPMNVYVDLDDDGACDDGEAFQAFQRSADEYFHAVVFADEAGDLSLVGFTEGVPLRVGAPCP